jgi:subtilisin family serine protease
VPNDPRVSDQWYIEYTDAYNGWDIVRGDTTRHSLIGIIDSGVHWDHPDLAPNINVNPAEDANHNGVFDSGDNNGVDNDGNGFVDDVVGWDLGDSDNNPVDDAAPHGTAVAGCASEVTDNGLRGAAIGFAARILCVKVFQGGMPTAGYQGMVYAADNGANVINCSWAIPSYSQAEQEIINAVWQSGALIVASAGAFSDSTRVYPAAYEHVMAVTSTDQTDHKASFASYGSWVDICAPGIDIWTTYGSSDFVNYSGTSFSTAMVSGLAALVRAWYPDLSNDETEDLIKISADTIYHLNPGYRGLLGSGRINCANWITARGCSYVPGDINSDGHANGIDIIYGVDYFGGGLHPADSCSCPPHPFPFYAAGDANGNCQFNGIDITYFVAYLKGNQPMLRYCPSCAPRAIMPQDGRDYRR